MALPHFHLTFAPPADRLDGLPPTWPNGCWSLYQITGDQIADCIKTDNEGGILERWPWPGFVGCFGSLEAATAKIAELSSPATANQKEVAADV